MKNFEHSNKRYIYKNKLKFSFRIRIFFKWCFFGFFAQFFAFFLSAIKSLLLQQFHNLRQIVLSKLGNNSFKWTIKWYFYLKLSSLTSVSSSLSSFWLKNSKIRFSDPDASWNSTLWNIGISSFTKSFN